MRVLVIGAVSGNGGDAAILLAQKRAIERAAHPEAVVVDVIDANPGVAARVVPGLGDVLDVASEPQRERPDAPGPLRKQMDRVVRRLRRSSAPQSGAPLTLVLPREPVLEALARADVVLYTGGTSLVENYDLAEKLAHLRVALLMGKSLVLGTQSLGPFRRQAHAAAMKIVVDGASSVLVREQRSVAHLIEVGADMTAVEVLPDVVFALAPEDLSPTRDSRGNRPVRVAISTRSWSRFTTVSPREGRERYIASIRGLVEHLVEQQGAEITFLSTCQGVEEYWIDDSAFAQEIVDGLSPGARRLTKVRRDHVGAEDLVSEYATFDLVVATRMHAAILAMCAGTPVVAIAYEFKTLELFSALTLPHLVIDIEDLTTDGLVRPVAIALDDLEQIRSTVVDHVLRWRDEAATLGVRVVEAARRGPGIT